MPLRRALSKEDQEAFDEIVACATQQLQAEVHLGRPWRYEAVIMAVLLAHEKQLEQVGMRLEGISAEKHLPDGNPPEGRCGHSRWGDLNVRYSTR